MNHYNGFPTHTKFEAPILIDKNGPEARIDCTKSYASIIGMMLYLESNTT